MSGSDFSTDADGRLRGSGIHDAVVREFHFADSGEFNLRMRGTDGEDRLVALRGVARLGMRDLINGTIISDIYCWKLDQGDLEGYAVDAAWRAIVADAFREPELPQLAARLAQEHADCYLVYFESSYGGEIAAVCREVRGPRVVQV
ncbi:hypothetical protein [Pseudoduganella sp. GCM10020061]|uniref:hypothetical protein n=1 Tax=Pseudoduganella sp. GCM10020061 TaxID=3317345 RepID=UPI0036372D96